MLIVGVGSAHADDGGQSAFNLLVGVEPWWWTVTWRADVEGNGIGVLCLTFVAAGYGGGHTSFEASGEDIAVVITWSSPNIAE